MSEHRSKPAFRVAVPFLMAACWTTVSAAVLLMTLMAFGASGN
jgi:hypothetical protein